jgi:hypothetical protein
MKTTSPLFTLILSVVASCTPIKNNETAVDSVQHVADTVTKEVAIAVEPPIDISKTSLPKFPAYSDSIYSKGEDSKPLAYSDSTYTPYTPTYSYSINTKAEDSITRNLIALLREYETRKFVKIKSTYSITYPVGNDYDDSTEDATQTETKTWYYDINRKLSAYTHTSKNAYVQRDVNDGSERVSRQKTTIYLFANEQLIAVYEDYDSNGQIGFSNKERIVAAQCPTCGVKIDSEDSRITVSPIDQAHVTELSKLFFEEYKKMLVDLQHERIERISGDNCFFSVQKPWDDRIYELKYSSNQSLYLTLLKTKP